MEPAAKRCKLDITQEVEEPQTPIDVLHELYPEIREHIIGFLDKKDRFNYGMSAKYCNEDIQRFDRDCPDAVFIYERDNGLELNLSYSLKNRVGYALEFEECGENEYRIRMTLKNGELLKDESNIVKEGNAVEEAWKYLKRRFKYLKGEKKVKSLDVHMKKWPTEKLNSIRRLKEATYIGMTIGEDNYEDIIKYISDNNHITSIDIKGGEEFKLPATFYKHPVIKKLEIAQFQVGCDIDEEDLMEMKAYNMEYQSSNITDKGINGKIKQWYNGERNTMELSIGNYSLISPDDLLADLQAIPSKKCQFRRPIDGMIGTLSIRNDTITFYADHDNIVY